MAIIGSQVCRKGGESKFKGGETGESWGSRVCYSCRVGGRLLGGKGKQGMEGGLAGKLGRSTRAGGSLGVSRARRERRKEKGAGGPSTKASGRGTEA